MERGRPKKRKGRIREEGGCLQLQRALMADEDGDRPIHVAVVHGDERLVRWLCHSMKSVGASLDLTNYLSQTPLHLAVLVKNVNLIRILLKEGATINPRDRRGNTVLHLAVQYFNRKCLDLLLQHTPCQSILNTRNYDGYTPLHVAVFDQNMAAIEMLLASGCDINAQDGKSGRTALMHSVLSKKDDIVCLLKKFGACSYRSDYSGVNPLHVATENGSVVMMAVLDGGTKKNRNIYDR